MIIVFQRSLATSLQVKLKEEYGCSTSRLDDFLDISIFDEGTTMNPTNDELVMGQLVDISKNLPLILLQVTSSTTAKWDWIAYNFIHHVKHKKFE